MPEPDQDHPIDAFERQLENEWSRSIWNSLSVLVAVSGGPDSVALLRALHSLKNLGEPAKKGQVSANTSAPPIVGRFEVAHFNHGWRCRESHDDEVFVSSLCEQLGVICHVGNSNQSEQKEELARNERYDFLRNVAEKRGARYVVTAHSANDQAETILHRIIRGTSLKGLSGIKRSRQLSEAVTVVRPMLWATREDVSSYLKRLCQTFRIDESNTDERFTRNRIRHELLPHLAQHYNSKIIESLLRLGVLSEEADRVIQNQIARRLEECVVVQNAKTVELDRSKLIALPEFLQREVLAAIWRQQRWPEQAMGFEQWKRLVATVRAETTLCLPGQVEVQANANRVGLIDRR